MKRVKDKLCNKNEKCKQLYYKVLNQIKDPNCKLEEREELIKKYGISKEYL